MWQHYIVMANVYEFLLGLGADPTEIQQLMASMQTQQTPSLIPKGQLGMRGDIATRPPARSQPQGIYRSPLRPPSLGSRRV